jgi:hypothetical protein
LEKENRRKRKQYNFGCSNCVELREKQGMCFHLFLSALQERKLQAICRPNRYPTKAHFREEKTAHDPNGCGGRPKSDCLSNLWRLLRNVKQNPLTVDAFSSMKPAPNLLCEQLTPDGTVSTRLGVR